MLYFHLPCGASEAAALETDCADPREEVTADIKHRGDADEGPCSLSAHCLLLSISLCEKCLFLSLSTVP